MLRVEASNLPRPRGAPRPRRLLPEPPEPPTTPLNRRPTRDEILPPIDDMAPPLELVLPEREAPRAASERWSVQLELVDADIARLYGQGLTRGAVVWKAGMAEWRPLLITPELFDLLRRTRTTRNDTGPRASQKSSTDVEVPRAARLPSDLAGFDPDAKPTFTTVAPTAIDVEPVVHKRRPIELLAVAAAAFALAWLGHAKLYPSIPAAATPSPAMPAVVAAPACEPTKPVDNDSATRSTIPTVSIADLPLAGVAAPAVAPPTGRGQARSARGSGAGPTRSDLVAALSQVARSSSSCGERGGPVRVVISFASSGVARSIQVSGVALPAGARSCIISAASRARVPAFAGDPVTVSKTL